MRYAVASNALAAFAALALLAAPAPARQAGVPPPPPVEEPNILLGLADADLYARLPETHRDLIKSQTEPRARFNTLLDASDALLADARARFDADQRGALNALFMYEAVLRCADRQLRCPEAKVPPRDKLFKKFERRLTSQVGALKALQNLVGLGDVDAAKSVGDSVTRLRIAALNSALDIDPSILRPEASQ
jgi:hypothetical protein